LTCELIFESYSHNAEEVALRWVLPPVTLMKQIVLPDFNLVSWAVGKSYENNKIIKIFAG
jgi:hypothetical protein